MQSVAQIYIFFEKIQKQNKLLKINYRIRYRKKHDLINLQMLCLKTTEIQQPVSFLF